MICEKELRGKTSPENAKQLQIFFKTGKGEYGEGDMFIGVKVPEVRKLAKEFKDASFEEIQELLNSEIHEHRQLALFILELQYSKTKNEKIVEIYKSNLKSINNWDLVDFSAPKILGKYYFCNDKSYLYNLANSRQLWEKRIAMLSTFYFIQHNDFDDALKIAEILLKDEHDLIHKSVGWMLREIGKRNIKIEEDFLKKHCRKMPRTMLRYAIEKFPENKRKKYLNGGFEGDED